MVVICLIYTIIFLWLIKSNLVSDVLRAVILSKLVNALRAVIKIPQRNMSQRNKKNMFIKCTLGKFINLRIQLYYSASSTF